MAENGYAGENVPVKPRTCLSINILVLRVLGIWFPEEEHKTWRFWMYLPYAIIMQGTLYGSYTLSEFIEMITVFGDIDKMSAVIFLFLTHVAEAAKMFFFYKNSQEMVKFLNALELETFTPKNEKQRKILAWAMRRARNDSVTLLSMAIATCLLWAIFPFIEKTGDIIKLPLAAWYPFDTTVSPNFQIVFIYQIIAVTSNALTNISMDTTATGMIIHICGQIDMLKDSLENMKKTAVESLIKKKQIQNVNLGEVSVDYSHEELEKEMFKTYKNCVIHHEEIIRFAEDIENVFNMVFLVQFAASVIIICLTMLRLSLMQSIYTLEFVSIALYQSCIVFELLLYCWHGNEMMLKSDSISNSIYNSQWYEFSPKFSRDIIFLMVRSKRPLRATAGKFFLLSLSTFVGILRLSWSYFAVLNSRDEKKN